MLFFALAQSIISSKSKIKSKRVYRLKFRTAVPCIPGAYKISFNIDFQVESIWSKAHVAFQGLLKRIYSNILNLYQIQQGLTICVTMRIVNNFKLL